MEKNFENGLARKLNQRSIEPSANAWERVKLQRTQKKSTSFALLYWIAAVLIIGVGLNLIQFSGEKTSEIQVVSNKELRPIESKPTTAAPQTMGMDEPTFFAPKASDVKNTQGTIARRGQEISISQRVAEINHHVKEQKTQEILHIPEQSLAIQQKPQDDLDVLIENARRDIAAGHGLSNTTDATALLKDSESELDESFRSGVFENLFKYKKIKVALSSH